MYLSLPGLRDIMMTTKPKVNLKGGNYAQTSDLV